ncbi:disease resistance protein RPV1-like [Arachis stenosperma]|uniref:disease resistance protein RPV1-like n=1 Tax=Arachis stenosperma TaxID=217475 RepID=UPI0025AD99F6|nr:disease resistance protein RPV1-like [Arachis stenosperma]
MVSNLSKKKATQKKAVIAAKRGGKAAASSKASATASAFFCLNRSSKMVFVSQAATPSYCIRHDTLFWHIFDVSNFRRIPCFAVSPSSWDSAKKDWQEAELIDEIVEAIFSNLNNNCYRDELKSPFICNRNYTSIKSLLKFKSEKVLVIGIWGMPGIGKTTIATTLFHECSSEYEADLIQLFRSCLSSGSKIILTTRDRNVLTSGGVEEIHEVKEMNFEDSLKLFSHNTFRGSHPKENYYELSTRVVADYAKGIPLALKILGSFLRTKEESEWDSALNKLRKYPNTDIQQVLRLSYDALDDDEKNILLDVACFFHEHEMKMDIHGVESMIVDMNQITIDPRIIIIALRKMPKLRLLALRGNINMDLEWNRVFLEDFQLPNELRYIEWDKCPLKIVPSICWPQKLVQLSMRDSNVEKLWDTAQNLPSLEFIDLAHNKRLIECPNLAGAANLKSVSLIGCESLQDVHPSIFSLPKIEKLYVSLCTSLKRLCSDYCSSSLRGLWATGCSDLEEFSISMMADHSKIQLFTLFRSFL